MMWYVVPRGSRNRCCMRCVAVPSDCHARGGLTGSDSLGKYDFNIYANARLRLTILC